MHVLLTNCCQAFLALRLCARSQRPALHSYSSMHGPQPHRLVPRQASTRSQPVITDFTRSQAGLADTQVRGTQVRTHARARTHDSLGPKSPSAPPGGGSLRLAPIMFSRPASGSARVMGNLASRFGHPRALSPSARSIPDYDTRSECGIPKYSPWVILHPLDGDGALQSVLRQ